MKILINYFQTKSEIEQVCTKTLLIRKTVYLEIEKYNKLLRELALKDPHFGDYKGNGSSSGIGIFDIDPLIFWRRHQHDFPLLSMLSKRYNSASASSAASNVYGKRRINLKPDYMESLIKLKINNEQNEQLKVVVDNSPISKKEFYGIWKTWVKDFIITKYACIVIHELKIKKWK